MGDKPRGDWRPISEPPQDSDVVAEFAHDVKGTAREIPSSWRDMEERNLLQCWTHWRPYTPPDPPPRPPQRVTRELVWVPVELALPTEADTDYLGLIIAWSNYADDDAEPCWHADRVSLDAFVANLPGRLHSYWARIEGPK